MSILIKGITLEDFSNCGGEYAEYLIGTGMADELPPHSDLIDRDELSKALNRLCDRVCSYSKQQRYCMCSSCTLGDAFYVVEDDAPAIIEAEGEGDD